MGEGAPEGRAPRGRRGSALALVLGAGTTGGRALVLLVLVLALLVLVLLLGASTTGSTTTRSWYY